MDLKWYQYFGVGAFVAGWFARAFVDGKITKDEQKELIVGIIELINVEIDVED